MMAIAFLVVRMLCDCFKSRRRLDTHASSRSPLGEPPTPTDPITSSPTRIGKPPLRTMTPLIKMGRAYPPASGQVRSDLTSSNPLC